MKRRTKEGRTSELGLSQNLLKVHVQLLPALFDKFDCLGVREDTLRWHAYAEGRHLLHGPMERLEVAEASRYRPLACAVRDADLVDHDVFATLAVQLRRDNLQAASVLLLETGQASCYGHSTRRHSRAILYGGPLEKSMESRV